MTSYSSAVFTSQAAGRRERHQYRRRLWNRLAIGMEAALSAGLALAGVAVSTWLAFCVGQSFAFTGFLHLVPVALAAMYGGFWQATPTSVVAAACLNYFFVPPIYLRARVYKVPRSLR